MTRQSVQIDAKSKEQGFPTSRLPHFTADEAKEIAGSFDFLGVNHYTSKLAEPKEPDLKDLAADSDVKTWQDDRLMK